MAEKNKYLNLETGLLDQFKNSKNGTFVWRKQ